MKKFYVAVEELYVSVTEQLPRVEGNPCGDCRSCCSAESMHSHQVGALELAYMRYQIGPERVQEFERYLDREKAGDALVYPYCPMLGDSGCSIHPYRPLSCRLYGHYRADNTPIFDHCVFKGREVVVPAEQQKQKMPGAEALTRLALDYAAYFPPRLREGERRSRQPQTPFERAVEAMAEAEFETALVLLKELVMEDDSALVNQMIGGCYQGMENFTEAARWFRRAIEHSPDNPQLHYRLGSVLFLGGALGEARTALEETLRLEPDRHQAAGMLGFIHLLEKRPAEAEPLLGQAVAAELEPGPYCFQLAVTQHCLGQLDSARKHYEMALRFGPTRADAERPLQAMHSHAP